MTAAVGQAQCQTEDCPQPSFARGMCRRCYGVAYRSGVIPKTTPGTRHRLSQVDRESRTALCSLCGPVGIRVKTGSVQCRTGANQTARTRSRQVNFRKRYSLSLEQWHALLTSQAGRCAICGDPMKEPHTDHAHDESAAVRGLLCPLCNQGIGMFRDDPERLASAISYLRASRG